MSGDLRDRCTRVSCAAKCVFTQAVLPLAHDTYLAKSVEAAGVSVSHIAGCLAVRRRALEARIRTQIGNHTFRATGITEYLRNGGKLEIARRMANHESARPTGLCDRRDDQVSLGEVVPMLIWEGVDRMLRS